MYIYVSSYENQVMRDRFDESNGTGQKVSCQIRVMEPVNKNRFLVDMDDLRCNRKQDGNNEKEKKMTTTTRIHGKTNK